MKFWNLQFVVFLFLVAPLLCFRHLFTTFTMRKDRIKECFTCWLYHDLWRWNLIIIRSKFFFLFIGREPTTWTGNNCLQIMVCSCAMPSNSLAANNILLMRKGNRAFLLAIALAWKWQIPSLSKDIHQKNKLGDRMIKQLLNSITAKYRDLSVSRRSIICRSRRLRQIIDLLATDKSRYFAQPRPIIVNYPWSVTSHFRGPWTVPVDPPSNPNIKIEILIYCPYTFSIEVVGKICWNIN